MGTSYLQKLVRVEIAPGYGLVKGASVRRKESGK
jgi:hypothetical protein